MHPLALVFMLIFHKNSSPEQGDLDTKRVETSEVCKESAKEAPKDFFVTNHEDKDVSL